MKKLVRAAVLALLTINGAARPLPAAIASAKAGYSPEREVRHELLMLPYYSVFDNLQFRVEGGTVILTGEVTQPTLKDDAERVVKNIEGVERVQNQIRVLPLSAVDDQIRIAAFRTIYGTPALNRYAHQAIPPIHIIVENGALRSKALLRMKQTRISRT